MKKAVVIGAGVGGLCAGARLAAAGWAVTVVERLSRVGGRWSTREVEGFKLPTGAFLIAMDDPLAQTFRDLGVDFPVRPIEERTVYQVNGKIVETSGKGGLRALVSAAAHEDGSDPDRVMTAIRDALSGQRRAADTPLPTWLREHGAGPDVVAAVHALTQAFMALNAVEVTATAFFDYLRTAAGRGRHGIPPQGSLSLARNLARHIGANGGSVLMGTGVSGLCCDASGRVTGAQLSEGTVLAADVVVSDIGPDDTASLLPQPQQPVHAPPATAQPAPGVTAFVASREPYFTHPAVVVTGTRCVCLVTTPTLVAPELAPEGYHYTETISTFRSSTDESDVKAERALHLADVDDLLPGWRDRGKLLRTSTYRGRWPVYRSWPGRDQSDRFPLPGLALVGDAVKPHGWPGTGASAESARIVVADIVDGRAAD